MGLFSSRSSHKASRKPPDDVVASLSHPLGRNASASSSGPNLGLDKLDKYQRQVYTCILLDQADHLGDDADDGNIVGKMEDEGSGGSDSESDTDSDDDNDDDDEATKARKKAKREAKKDALKQQANKSTIGFPPKYTSLAPLAPRYRIVPREEEGHEKLPGYKSHIFREGLLERKVELDTPFDGASNRKWMHVHVELNNTKLSIYSVSSRIGRNSKKYTDSLTDKSYKIKQLIKVYSLQYADVGLASDYDKKSNCIRIRAEGEQFLLAAATELDCVEWARNLMMGTEISLPLEERKLPKLRSIPRRRHGRRRREELEEQRMSRDLMLRPYSSRMSAVSLSSTVSRPQSRPPARPRGSSSGTETGVSHFNRNHRSSVHFHTPAHPRRSSTPGLSHTTTHSSSMSGMPGLSGSSYMFDADWSEDEDFTANNNANNRNTSLRAPRSNESGAAPTSESSSVVLSPSTSAVSSGPDDDHNDDNQSSATSASVSAAIPSIQDPEVEEHDTESDDEADTNLLRPVNTQATTTSMTFTFGYKWNPAKLLPTQSALIKYARRCLAQLPEDTPWLNKKIVKDGAKYIVHERKLEKISQTVAN